jgi:hypothetical protein
MLILLAGLLFVLWLMAFTVFHVASGLIHFLLLMAAICLIIRFASGHQAA